jgi:hypothetical protein
VVVNGMVDRLLYVRFADERRTHILHVVAAGGEGMTHLSRACRQSLISISALPVGYASSSDWSCEP